MQHHFPVDLEIEPLKLMVKLNDNLIQDVYSACYQINEKSWVNWMATEPQYKIPNIETMQVLNDNNITNNN